MYVSASCRRIHAFEIFAATGHLPYRTALPVYEWQGWKPLKDCDGIASSKFGLPVATEVKITC